MLCCQTPEVRYPENQVHLGAPDLLRYSERPAQANITAAQLRHPIAVRHVNLTAYLMPDSLHPSERAEGDNKQERAENEPNTSRGELWQAEKQPRRISERAETNPERAETIPGKPNELNRAKI